MNKEVMDWLDVLECTILNMLKVGKKSQKKFMIMEAKLFVKFGMLGGQHILKSMEERKLFHAVQFLFLAIMLSLSHLLKFLKK